MGFDQNPPSPHRLVRPDKPDTKINILMVISILVFFAIGLGVLIYIARESG